MLQGVDYEGARRKVQDLDPEDIIFLQNLRTPPDRIKLCLEAVVTVLNNTVNKKITWDVIKKTMMDINFRKRIFNYDAMIMTKQVEGAITK